MSKAILLSYNPEPFYVLGDNSVTSYELEILKVYLFGLIKIKSNLLYEVPVGEIEKHQKHWDKMIATKKIMRSAQ